ncbi:MAG: FadR family transcriptional regulator [Pseudolabrys sp.]|nr:FadR family transcriptional regulator [Pseudolabrys sp.]MBV9261400.1 FadR family transcriptional regulator [Pseudolabrys sp.]
MTAVFPKPVAQSLPNQVAALIMQRVASGELVSGHKLPSQRQLAQSMGVGLAVVREAVKRLEALNVLDATHGSGTVVQPFRWMPLLYDQSLFTLAMKRIGIRDLWETRRLLEGQIVRLAAERARKENLAEIRAVLDRTDPLPVNYDDSSALNREFHIAVAKASHNGVLVDLLTPLVDVHFQGIAHHFTEDVCRRTWQAHASIYRAIAKHDVAAAERAMRDHFTVGPIAVETHTSDAARSGSRSKPVRNKPHQRRK